MRYLIQIADQLRTHLRSLRQERGLTQAQLGDRLGLGQARIAEIESAPGVVSVEQIIRILAALGASLELSDRKADPVEDTAGRNDARKRATNKQNPLPKLPDTDRRATKLRGATGERHSYLAESSKSDGSRQTQATLQTLNPARDVLPTSRRNFVIRSKKGSW